MARRIEIKIKQMEAAIALAETLNFTNAARIVHVSQPTLTRYISKLEEELGFELFERTKRQVKVNDAGRAYVEKERLSVFYHTQAIQAARAARQDARVLLRIGRSPYTDPFLSSALGSIHLPLYPSLKIEWSSQFSYDLSYELLGGQLDFALVTEPPESALLSKVKVAQAPFYIAMSEQDELATKRSVTLDDLSNRCWVLFERRMHPLVYDNVMDVSQQRKVKPAKVEHIVMPEDAFPLITDNSCVAFTVKAGALRIARNGVTVRPLAEDDLLLKTYFASHIENKSKVASELLRAFVRKIESFGGALGSCESGRRTF